MLVNGLLIYRFKRHDAWTVRHVYPSLLMRIHFYEYKGSPLHGNGIFYFLIFHRSGIDLKIVNRADF